MTGVGYKGPRKDKLFRMNEEGVPQLYSGDAAGRMEARFRSEAEDLLERVLLRRRWSAVDRYKVAEFLMKLVERERRAAAKRAGGA